MLKLERGITLSLSCENREGGAVMDVLIVKVVAISVMALLNLLVVILEINMAYSLDFVFLQMRWLSFVVFS